MARFQTPILIFSFAFLLSTILLHSSVVFAIRHGSKTWVFSLSLHHPDSKLNHTAIQGFSRLEGDKARVNYINSRLRKALFKSSDPRFGSEEIQTPIANQGGAYIASLGVGQPATEFNLLADTGSEVTWLQCAPCTSGCEGSVFDPSRSSSYQPLSCSSQKCDALQEANKCGTSSDGGCSYAVSYGDQSFSRGDFITETLSFGRSGTVRNVGIGCGRENGGNVADGGFTGILGLGPSPISFPSQIKATSFSYCLVEPGSGSSSTLDFNSVAPRDSVNVALNRNPSADVYYYVELSGITVGEDQVQIPPSVYKIGSDGTGGIIVDSGTTLTYLDSDVYSSFIDAFQRNAQNLPGSPVSVQGLDSCYKFPSGTSASSIKGLAMKLEFSDGQTVPFGPGNYFIQVDNSTFCLAFQPTGQIVSIIGNVLQSGMRVTYDLGNSLIGFSPKKC
ncbi:OLC1v1014255C1 [Oldenlandia corymbosa var. corymbosa]|uniref:OLC1v1014255C1 n=1 Tax=Oldenlandia corymbosa var. corymbosa TaxID=529605 RepID=A0AAV1E3K9_OLDCO|nr:OLC1v1014255C1 [Oldenlandia corymbosa var. corymbosa]